MAKKKDEYSEKVSLIKEIERRKLLKGCGTKAAIKNIYMGMSVQTLENMLDEEYQQMCKSNYIFWGDMTN